MFAFYPVLRVVNPAGMSVDDVVLVPMTMSSWSPSLPVINAENLVQLVETDPTVIILLWAVWDPTSRSLDAWLQRASAGYPNLRFYAMDLDQEQNWPFAAKCGIMTTPTLVCLFNGVLHELLVGLRPEPQMREKLFGWNLLGLHQAPTC